MRSTNIRSMLPWVCATCLAPALFTPSTVFARTQTSAGPVASFFAAVFSLGFLFVFAALLVGGGIWFFSGPVKHANDYVESRAALIASPADRQLYYQIYTAKQPKNIVLAWFLSVLLSPSIAYVYMGKWALAVISFITFQGLGFWWLLGIFTMPTQVMALNKQLADQAFNEIMLARPGLRGAMGTHPIPIT